MNSSRFGGTITYREAINFSTAKQKYSFGLSKSHRFPQLKKAVNERIGYDIPDTKNKRAPSFGIGQRFSTPLSQRERKLQLFLQKSLKVPRPI